MVSTRKGVREGGRQGREGGSPLLLLIGLGQRPDEPWGPPQEGHPQSQTEAGRPKPPASSRTNRYLFSPSQDAPREGDASPSGAYLLPSGALRSTRPSEDSLEESMTSVPRSPAQPGEELHEPELQGTGPSVPPGPSAASPPLPGASTEPAFLPRKKLPLLRQVNTARRQLRPKAASQTAALGPGLLSSGTEKPGPPGDPGPVASQETLRLPSEEPLWPDQKEGAVPTTPAPLQISPFTSQPYVLHTLPRRPDPGEPAVLEEAQEAPPEDASLMTLMDKGENELTGSASEDSQETTTSTIITTTVITTEQAPGMHPRLLQPPGSCKEAPTVSRAWGWGTGGPREGRAPPSATSCGTRPCGAELTSSS